MISVGGHKHCRIRSSQLYKVVDMDARMKGKRPFPKWKKNKNAKVEAYDYIFHHFSCFLTAFVNFGLYIDHLDTATDINLVKRFSPSLKNHSLKFCEFTSYQRKTKSSIGK